MATRRMISLKIVDTDAFLDMPVSSQLLYFHLSVRADDDGFVSNPKKIMRMIGAQDDDYRVLVAKKFIIQFDSGVCVIKHWLIHNLIRSDRYSETNYTEEKSKLIIDKKNKKYSLISGTEQMTFGYKEYGKQIDEVKKEASNNIGEKYYGTPKSNTIKFFNDVDIQNDVVKNISEKYKIDNEFIRREVYKFISYWTELNHSGTKQRWEKEKTFEVNRRLATWLSNTNKFSRNDNLPKVIKI